jgi:hypothetical protein
LRSGTIRESAGAADRAHGARPVALTEASIRPRPPWLMRRGGLAIDNLSGDGRVVPRQR